MDNLQKRKKLIFWRIDNNLKQVEIAKKLGITSGHLSNIERGAVNPSYELMSRFERVFNVDNVSELFGRERY